MTIITVFLLLIVNKYIKIHVEVLLFEGIFMGLCHESFDSGVFVHKSASSQSLIMAFQLVQYLATERGTSNTFRGGELPAGAEEKSVTVGLYDKQ
jgi:hypothetical protein